jgi:tetratricopeptide (TPR) repeat protein
MTETTCPTDAQARAPRRSWRATLIGPCVVLGGGAVGGVAAWALWAWLEPPNPRAIQATLHQNQWEGGEKLARQYLQRRPNDPEAILLLGRALGGRQAYAECAAVLETVPADAPQRPGAMFRAGEAWSQDHWHRRAERAWRECLDARSSPAPDLYAVQNACRWALAELYWLERREQALHTISREMYRRAEPRQRHAALAMRARYRLVTLDPTVALDRLKPALEQDSRDVLTRRAIGFYELEAGNFRAARTMLYRCLSEAGEEPLVWESWLECLDRSGGTLELEHAVRRLPSWTDASANCWKYRAVVAAQRGELDDAVAAIRRALELAPFQADLHHRATQFLMRVGQSDEAQQHATRYRELQAALDDLRVAFTAYQQEWLDQPTKRPRLASTLGQACERLGEREDAVDWYQTGLSEHPGDPACLAALERLRPPDL